MSLEVVKYRAPLLNTRAALAQGSLTVGFLGGSITDARPGCSWPEPVLWWLAGQFPAARIMVENAAIGATGSDLGVFRTRRDIVARSCRLVFVEYAVNDMGETPERRRRTREGVIRQLLASGECDVIIVYTFSQAMYAEMLDGRVPASIAEYEELAEHYGISSIWAGLYALHEVMTGQLRWEEWLPDQLHPQSRGSLSYAQSVIELLREQLAGAPPAPPATGTSHPVPPPVDAGNWEHATVLPFSLVRTKGPWLLRRSTSITWMDQLLTTAAVGASLSFEFEGRGLVLGFDFGRTSSEFRYRLDGGEWTEVARDRPAWCGDSGWYRAIVIADDLPRDHHAFELVVTHGNRPECTGSNCHLALIGVLH